MTPTITIKNSRGFTIIEVVTVIVVLAMLSGFTFGFMDSGIKMYTMIREQERLYTDGTFIMERLARELRDARQVTAAGDGIITFITCTHTTPHPSPGRTGKTITYLQAGRNLTWNDGGPSRMIGKNIQTFRTALNVDGSVTVILSVNSLTDATIPAFTLQSTIVPNNIASGGGYQDRYYYGNYYEVVK